MATLGQTTNNGNTQTFSGDRMYLSSDTASATEILDSGAQRIWVSAAASPLCKLVVYSDVAGVPTTFLAESDAVTISNTSEAEIAFTFSGANRITITSGVKYHFGAFFDDPGTPNMVMSRANTASQVYYMSTAYPTPPTTFVSGGAPAAGPHDCYLTTVPASGGNTTNFLRFI